MGANFKFTVSVAAIGLMLVALLACSSEPSPTPVPEPTATFTPVVNTPTAVSEPTATPAPAADTPTAVPEPTAIPTPAADTPTADPEPTTTPTPAVDTQTAVPEPTAIPTPVVDLPTAVPEPTATPTPVVEIPTAVPEPTAIPTLVVVVPTAVPEPTVADTVVSPAEESLSFDPSVVRGTLANGMAYYVRRNVEPLNRAQLSLVVKAGSVHEEENQRGLAHFVEHMAFNGTERFEKQQIVDYLESIGSTFGADLNAYTSFDETVYWLEIPTDDPEILETAFQILSDWAYAVSFDPEEVELERDVVLEECV